MRDMLARLQTISEEHNDDEESEYEAEENLDNVISSFQAVVFDESTTMEDVLSDAHSIRKEISLIQIEIKRLKTQNGRYGTTVRRLTLLKKDSDSIAREIQQKSESVYDRLQALRKESKKLEEEQGSSSAISRIARHQYDTLTYDFHSAMEDFNSAEEEQKIICRQRIKRQASIMGKAVSDQELDEMVEKGGEGWSELSQNLQDSTPRTLKMALSDIKGRHKELLDLEARLKQIHELFQQMATLVEEQGSMVNSIQFNVMNTKEHTEHTNDYIKRAVILKKKNPFLQCCPCMPCWKM